MEFEAIFLDKAALSKYRLLKQLLAGPRFDTIADLAGLIHQSYQRTYNLFQELVCDLASMGAQDPEVVREQLGSHPGDFSLDHYRLWLLERSLSWQYFDYLAQHHQPNADRFCSEHFISRSTLARKITPLRRLLANYQIQLTASPAGFAGTEMQIRLALGCCYWQATRGVSWPFVSLAETAMRRALPALRVTPAPLVQQRALYQLAVTRLRLAQHHRLEAPQALGPTNDLPAVHFPTLPAQAEAVENAGFAFMQLIVLDLDHEAPSAVLAALTQLMPEAPTLTASLQEALSDPVALTWTPVIYANLLRLVVSFRLIGGDYLKLADFCQPPTPTPTTAHLQQRALAWAKRHMPAPARSSFASMCAFVVAPLWPKAYQVDVVKVAVASDLMTRRLHRFLTDLPHVTVVSDGADCDVLIATTDSLIISAAASFSAARPHDTIMWLVDATQADYHQLYTRLCQKHHAKLAALSQKGD